MRSFFNHIDVLHLVVPELGSFDVFDGEGFMVTEVAMHLHRTQIHITTRSGLSKLLENIHEVSL